MEDAGNAATPQDLNLLRTFLAVYRTGSFTAAAHVVGLSQPTVTTQIRSLEKHLGHELFERQARGVAPVAAADELAARIGAPFDAFEAAAANDGPHAHTTEPVRLAGPAEFLCAHVLPSLAPLVAQNGVRLRVATGLTDPLLEQLSAGRHDLLIATFRPRGRALTALPLVDEEFVLVAAPSWADRYDGPASLHRIPLIAYAEDLPIARRYWRHVFNKRLTCAAAVTVPDLRGVLAAVVAGAGFSVLPRYLCQDELTSGALVVLHEPDDAPINTAYLVQRPGSAANPHVMLVRERLIQAARDG